MGRITSFGVAIVMLLGAVKSARAGEAGSGPAVRVLAPGGASGASGAAMELDDLPAPQLEVMNHPARIEPPAIPAFERTSPAEQIELDVETTSPRLRKAVNQATLDASIEHLDACNKAVAARHYDAAIAACRAATEAWQDNHLAWYALASAHLARQEWRDARTAAEHAVGLRPDRAMYQLYLGISRYEAERQRERGVPARNDHTTPGDLELDRSRLELRAARDPLALAAGLVPELWRAHYYLGRVDRDLDDSGRAARQFTAAIKAHPGHRPSYIALSELYRTSGHVEQALAVARLGIAQVPAAEAADLWFEAGMAYDARRADDAAIDAFGKVIAIKPGDALAKLERGQLYLRAGDVAGATRDLDDAMRSPDPRVATAKPAIAKLLAQLASNTDAARDTRWDCRRSGDALLCQPRSR
jgi:tetratricopeptide (TPR) repeat protein